ncbi:MAG: NfeD family protein [Prevotellamassilia sp.]|jgi:membrane-bound ClpP family serine protease|nr:NfeD family protein [Prevotellamassilia sp.]
MTLIIILAALSLVLGLLEIFILPGFGFAGIGSIVCAVVDAILIYNAYGFSWACIAVVVAILLLVLMLYIVANSRTFDRMSLKTSIDSTNATTEQLSVKVGNEGRAITRLALVGNAEIEGKQVEVKSSGEFINSGTPIRVIKVDKAQIIVERTDK